MKGFAASPIDTVMAEQDQRIQTRHVGASRRAFRARLPHIFTVRSFKVDIILRVFSWTSKFTPQNRCFVRGIRQFSSHVTKCHACHGICTLSPLRAALTMQFAENTQRDTSEVLRLPRKMTTQKYCAWHTKRLSTRYVTKCHACHVKRGYAMSEGWPLLQNSP